MSRWINSDPMFTPYLAEILEIAASNGATQLSEFDGVEPICGALFDGYNSVSVHAHIWIAPGRRPSRLFWWATYDYLFNQCKVLNVIGTVPAGNEAAQKLDEHLGFVLNSVIQNYYPSGEAMMLYVCTPETVSDSWRNMRPARAKVKEQEDGQEESESASSA